MALMVNGVKVRGVRSSRSVGLHLLLDCWECKGEAMQEENTAALMLQDAVKAISAHLLHSHIHRFQPHGLTGFALLQESHISIHTWPEIGFAAIDIFSCGKITPEPAVEVFQKYLKPGRVRLRKVSRGSLR
ncbi:MAG: adenosylmethionine decarboxylase [bacterium JZ-2024 1]